MPRLVVFCLQLASLALLYASFVHAAPQDCDNKSIHERESHDFVMLYQFTKIDKGNAIPKFDALGLRLAKIAYEGRFALKSKKARLIAKSPLNLYQELPATRIIDRAAKMIKQEQENMPKSHSILDIELWHVRTEVSDTLALANMTRYLRLLSSLRQRLPGRKWGNYGLPVHRNYRASSKPSDHPLYNAWQRRNDLMQPLADELDIFMPTLYTFELDAIDKWVKHARAHVRESRRLANNKQSVIPFIWPQYHNRSRHEGKFLSYAFWKIQLETLYDIADGIYIWSNQKDVPDDDAGWWIATQEFVSNLKARGVSINNFVE